MGSVPASAISFKDFNERSLLVRHGYRIHARHATRSGHGMIITFTNKVSGHPGDGTVNERRIDGDADVVLEVV